MQKKQKQKKHKNKKKKKTQKKQRAILNYYQLSFNLELGVGGPVC